MSCVVLMPDLTKLDIPEKQRLVYVKDEIIFRSLQNEKRQLEDQNAGAGMGDYVLIEMHSANGHSQTLHVELGGRHFPELEQLLMGCKAGQTLPGKVWGENLQIRVQSVRKVVNFPLTDDAIASLGISETATLMDYRRKYIQEHGMEIADRLFRKMQTKLMEKLVMLAELSLDLEDLNYYHQQQREMIQNLTGDVQQRLLDAYGPKGGKTAEECDRMFFEENKRFFAFYIWAKELAKQNRVCPSEEDCRKAMDNFGLMFEKTEEQIQAEGLVEDALRSFYLQYGIGKLREYFCSVIRFSATGISSQGCTVEA